MQRNMFIAKAIIGMLTLFMIAAAQARGIAR